VSSFSGCNLRVEIFPRIKDHDSEGLIEMVVENHMRAQHAVFRRSPIIRVEEGFYEMLTGVDSAFANSIMGRCIPDAVNRVPEITNRVRHMGVPAYWWVAPGTTPSDIGEILAASGWSDPHPVPAMAADIDLVLSEARPDDLDLREVASPEELVTFRRLIEEIFTMPPQVTEFLDPLEDGSLRLYTAYVDDEPVGTTALFLDKGIAGVYCVGTLIKFRGRGIGAALTARPLAWAREQGYRTSTLQATSMGYRVYRKLGFFDVCNLDLYAFGKG